MADLTMLTVALPAALLLLAVVWGIGTRPSVGISAAGRVRARRELQGLRVVISQLLIDAPDKHALLESVCQRAVAITDFSLVFVGRRHADGPFIPLAQQQSMSWMEQVLTEPAQAACHLPRFWEEGLSEFLPALASDADAPAWQRAALRHGFGSCAMLSIRHGEKKHAVLIMLHRQADVFDDELRGVLLDIARDISQGLERIESQRLQHALLENSRAGIVLMAGRLVMKCNTRFAEMLGYRPEELIGRDVRMIYPDEGEYARVGGGHDRLVHEGRVAFNTVSFRRKDGSVCLCDLSGSRLDDMDEALSVWTLEDVTERESQARHLSRLARFNALLAEVNRFSIQMEDEARLFQALCQAAVSLGDMALAWIGRPDAESSEFQPLAAAGEVDYLSKVHIFSDPAKLGGNGPTGNAWRTGRPVFIARYSQPDLKPIYARLAEDYRFGSFASLPIRDQGVVAAVLTVYCRQEEMFDDEVKDLFLALVSCLERGLQDISQRQRIRNLQQLYQALMSEGDVVLQARSTTEMLVRTCERLVHDTQFHASWAGRPDESGKFQVLAAAGRGTGLLKVLDVRVSAEPDAPLVAQAWHVGEMRYLNDVQNAPQCTRLRPFFASHDWHAVLAAPVRRGGEVWAVLVFASPQPDVFDKQTIELCRTVAALLGHGLDEMDLKQRLERLQVEEAHRARHDALTGLPNRYAMTLHLDKAMARARRQGSLLAVGLLDLDDFKPVNDTWGHDAGDQLLRQLAMRLLEGMREADMLVRLGGDEFLVVMEDLERQSAHHQLRRVLARLHQAVELPFEVADGRQVRVGMSMGVALYPEHGEDAEQLLRNADAAMYRAKQNKRQRANWWSLA